MSGYCHFLSGTHQSPGREQVAHLLFCFCLGKTWFSVVPMLIFPTSADLVYLPKKRTAPEDPFRRNV